MSKVYIGVGHGGSDSGAVANGLKEKDLTLSIGKYVDERLKQYGCDTKMSRTVDKDVSIDTKVAESDKFKADACMDIHINAGGGNGCEIYYSAFRKDKAKSKSIASNIETALKSIGQVSRGLKTKANSTNSADYFGMVRRPDAPSVLIECGFIDNKTDLSRFDTENKQKKFGYAIADGVALYLNLKLKEDEDMLAYKEMLRILKYKGVITTKVDENAVVGSGTVKATKEIQKLSGLKETGEIDAATIKAAYKLISQFDTSLQKNIDADKSTIKTLNKKIADAQKVLK